MHPDLYLLHKFFNAPNNPVAQVSSSNTTLTMFTKTQPILEKWFSGISNTYTNYYNSLNRGQEEGALQFEGNTENDPMGAKQANIVKSNQWNVNELAQPLQDITDPGYSFTVPKGTYTTSIFTATAANDLVNCGEQYFSTNPRQLKPFASSKTSFDDQGWTPANFMAFFALTNKIYTQIPMKYERTEIISGQDFFNTIGLGFLNKFVHGYNWGWNSAYGVEIGDYIKEPTWINSNLSGYLRTQFMNANPSSGANAKHFLPLFSFSDTASGSLDQLISSTHTSLNIGGMLTDQLNTSIYNLQTGQIITGATRGIPLSSVTLGQTFQHQTDKTNPDLFVTYDYENFNLQPPAPRFKNLQFNGYFVEQVFSRAYCKSNFTVQLYDGLPTKHLDKYGNATTNVIYTGSFMTFSKYTDNMRNVTTSVRTAILHKNYTGEPHPWPNQHTPIHKKYFKFTTNSSLLYTRANNDFKTMANNTLASKNPKYLLFNDTANPDFPDSLWKDYQGWSNRATKKTVQIDTRVRYANSKTAPLYSYIVLKGNRVMKLNNTWAMRYWKTTYAPVQGAPATSTYVDMYVKPSKQGPWKHFISKPFYIVADIRNLSDVKIIIPNKTSPIPNWLYWELWWPLVNKDCNNVFLDENQKRVIGRGMGTENKPVFRPYVSDGQNVPIFNVEKWWSF